MVTRQRLKRGRKKSNFKILSCIVRDSFWTIRKESLIHPSERLKVSTAHTSEKLFSVIQKTIESTRGPSLILEKYNTWLLIRGRMGFSYMENIQGLNCLYIKLNSIGYLYFRLHFRNYLSKCTVDNIICRRNTGHINLPLVFKNILKQEFPGLGLGWVTIPDYRSVTRWWHPLLNRVILSRKNVLTGYHIHHLDS